MTFPRLVGATEIADALALTRQRVQQLAHEPGFPRPVAVLRMGSVWRARDVETWAEDAGRELREWE